jgi:RimJ/RimL family protein N-acetyltransferase
VRVVLRRLAPADLTAFQAYRHDEQVGLYQGWEPQSDVDAAQFIADMSGVALFAGGQWVQLGIADARTNALLGDVGICVAEDGQSAEIGFTLSAAAQGVGLGTEAVRETIGLVFDGTRVERIVAVTDERNVPAVRLLERVGMRRLDTVAAVFRGQPCVEHVYAISREER